MRARLPFAFACALATLGLAADADAYCRAKACDDKPAYDDIWQEVPDQPCYRDQYNCLIEGTPLHWPKTCISFGVQKDGSVADGIDYAAAHDTIAAAFAAWLEADCGGGERPSFAIADYSPIECTETKYWEDRPNANIFVFRDELWPYRGTEDTLALTTISYNMENGEIYDADVEINSADEPFVVADQPSEYEADLLAIMTHEVGHFLGLSHSALPAATMWQSYVNGETQQRTLHADDIAGICEIYPPGRSVDSDDCEPRHGFSSECPGPPDEGCSIAARSAGGGGAFWLAGLALAGFVRRRRRR